MTTRICKIRDYIIKSGNREPPFILFVARAYEYYYESWYIGSAAGSGHWGSRDVPRGNLIADGVP